MKHHRYPAHSSVRDSAARWYLTQGAYSAPHGLHGIVRRYGIRKSAGKGQLAVRTPAAWQTRADLVITGHENKYLMNSWLFLLSSLQLKTVALWGLGPCMEEDQSRMSHWLREKALMATDWYFGYTSGIVPYLTQHGVSGDRITEVQTAIDTGELRKSLESITEDEVDQAKSRLGIATGPVGIYCGILEPTKHIPFLIDAARVVRQRVPNFQLLIVGTGPDRTWLEETARANPWIHYLGQKFDRDKALALRMADIFVLPGRVGLAILDSFAAGLPLFTTDIAIHGPEASYLIDGYNGRKTAHRVQAYADAVVEVLRSPLLLERLRQSALATASSNDENGGKLQAWHQTVPRFTWLHAANGFRLTGMRTLSIIAALVPLFAFALKPMTLTPPSAPVPASLFGMPIHYVVSPKGTDRLPPWPRVPVPAWRLWDARVTWPDLEPNKGQWRFENLDRSGALAEAHHTEVLLTLGLTPRWASARPQEPSGYAPGYAAEPKDIEDWRTFVRTVATRYNGRIHLRDLERAQREEILDGQHRPVGNPYT